MKITPEFFTAVRDLIVAARTTIARGVDLVQVHTNFEIGRRIVQEEQRGRDRAGCGEQILIELAAGLTAEFGKGFSLTNLKLMRLFYFQHPQRIGQSLTDQFNAALISQTLSGQLPIRQTLSGESVRPFALSWTHYVFLLRVKSRPSDLLKEPVEGIGARR